MNSHTIHPNMMKDKYTQIALAIHYKDLVEEDRKGVEGQTLSGATQNL